MLYSRNVEEVIYKRWEALKEKLVERYDELGMRSSGNWARELEVYVEKDSSGIRGLPYTEQLALGRPPGKFPPRAAIEGWIEDKPITPRDGISVSSLAFLIARKIANEGTEYFKQGGTDLIESVITPDEIQEILNDIGVVFANEIIISFTRELRALAV